MKIQLQKEKIKKEIDSINDETYLHAIQLLIEDALSEQKQATPKPLSIEEYIQRAEEAEEAIAKGNVKSIDEVKKESKEWNR